MTAEFTNEGTYSLGKGSFEKKKVKNFLNLCPDPDPPKKLRKTKIYFFSMLTQQIFSAGEEKNLWKKLKNTAHLVTIMKIIQVLQVRRGYPPIWKKFFSADLDELGHEKIKIKKLRKWEKFVLTPPPC